MWVHGLFHTEFVCDLELGICDLFGILNLGFGISGLRPVIWDFEFPASGRLSPAAFFVFLDLVFQPFFRLLFVFCTFR